jgi:hypothetical protein
VEMVEMVRLETAAELDGSLGSVPPGSGKECKSGGCESLVKGGGGPAP